MKANLFDFTEINFFSLLAAYQDWIWENLSSRETGLFCATKSATSSACLIILLSGDLGVRSLAYIK